MLVVVAWQCRGSPVVVAALTVASAIWPSRCPTGSCCSFAPRTVGGWTRRSASRAGLSAEPTAVTSAPSSARGCGSAASRSTTTTSCTSTGPAGAIGTTRAAPGDCRLSLTTDDMCLRGHGIDSRGFLGISEYSDGRADSLNRGNPPERLRSVRRGSNRYGARYVSRYDARIVERVRLAA
jgi:hypothetical protein